MKKAAVFNDFSGYFISKLIGIKVISELKKENRLKFIILSVAVYSWVYRNKKVP